MNENRDVDAIISYSSNVLQPPLDEATFFAEAFPAIMIVLYQTLSYIIENFLTSNAEKQLLTRSWWPKPHKPRSTNSFAHEKQVPGQPQEELQ